MEMATTISRRKSFVPHKSVNFQQAQDDLDRSDEMEFTNAFPAMAMRANESNLDESEMEETGVFPRKSFRPVKASAVPLWQQSVPDQAKSMDLSNTYTQPQSLDDSGMEFTSAFPHKFSRKSISGNMMRNRDSESLDGSGMEMTEAFPAMPPEEYDVSMSDSMSDMDITNQYNQPPDVTNNHSMMITNQTSTANMSADFSIITSYPKSVGRKSMVVKSSEQNNFQTNETSVAFDKQGVSEYQTVPSHRVYDQHHTQHKSFSGFEQSALNLSSATLRKSAPHVMNPYYDIPTHGNADVNQSHTNTHSFKGNTSMVNFPAPMNASMGTNLVPQSSASAPYIPTDKTRKLSTVVAPEVNTEDSKKEIEQEAKAQQPSESNEAYSAMPNTNKSVIQTEIVEKSLCEDISVLRNNTVQPNESADLSIQKPESRNTHPQEINNTRTEIVEKSLCEDISVLRNNTVQPNESADLSVQKPESRNTHPQEINNINELSNNASVLSDSALNASNASNSNSAVKQVSSVNESKCDTVDPVPCVIEPAVKPDSPARNDSQVQVSMDDGFSTHSQSIESGISPLQSVLCTSGVLDVSKMSCDLDTEKSRKRPSDGFEAHEENLVETGDAMVVANPKKRSKTFEPVDSIRETHEAEVNAGTEENPVSTSPDKTSGVAEHKSPAKAVSPGKNFEFATPGKSSVRSTPNKTAAATTTGKTSTSASSSKETFVFVTPGKTSSVRSTPNKTGTFATPNKPSGATPNKPSATPNKPSGATPNKPSATPNKPSGVVTPKGPAGTTPNKSLVIPEKLFNDTGCSQDGSFNMSTYVNPSSTLTDSAINNITDIDLPIIGSTRKPTASEVKSKQMVTCFWM
ncbi:proteoglycan 4-like [Diaphorina citri]|uniref:Proteoglycan 4-like n=1 Tax=Diaphorina citri TaxID=121845 RepID=A0A3Q0JB28_DIACI|nr:proteoglycan 4-like [Diaphorina citri]